MPRHCILIGATSEIAQGIASRLQTDGWTITGLTRHAQFTQPLPKWDLFIVAQGTMEPIGRFFETPVVEWQYAMDVNAMKPLRWLRIAWPQRNPGACVVFLGGPNMARMTPTYTAYRASKSIIESICGTLEMEYPGHRFRVLHPGVVQTRIHQETIRAGHRAANYERVKRIVSGEEKTVTHDEVYAKLKGLIA